MTGPGFRQVIGRAKWYVKLFAAALLLLGALHGLYITLWLLLGILGDGWRLDALLDSAGAVAFVYAVLAMLYWKGYAKSLEPRGRRVDVTTVPPGTFSIPAGTPTAEALAAAERIQRRRALATQRSAGFGR